MKPPLEMVGLVILPEHPVAAGIGRRWLGLVLADLTPDLVDTIQMLGSELVANAVIHGGGDPRVLLRRSDKVIRVEVSDRGPGVGLAQRTAANDEENGRGLHIVDMAAQAWGVEREEGRTTVWFETSTI